MTKDSARQLFADRLRHAKVKFLFDPSYVAAKKKPLEERLQSQNEGSKSRKKKKAQQSAGSTSLPSIEEQSEETLEENEVPVDEEASEEIAVTQNVAVNGVYMAFSDGPLNYVNVVDSVDGESNYALWMTLVALVIVFGSFLLGYVEGRRSRDALVNAAVLRAQESEQQSGAFAVVMPQLEEALIRARQDALEADPEYRRAQNFELRESLRLLRLRNVDLVALRNHANRVVERALDESTWHVDEECLFGKRIYVASHDGVWHADRNCGGEHYDVVLHQHNRTGVSLHRDLENFLEQSAQVRGESEEESENDEVIEDQAARVRRYQNASLGEVSDPEFWQAVNHFEGSDSD